MADPQVVIVGAGPVGLTLALGLHQSGVPAGQILVADECFSKDQSSANKALSMSASSLEVLRTLGIADRFLAAGVPIRSAHFGGGARLLDLNHDVLGTTYPFNYSIPQWKTEAILQHRCEEVGIAFAWGRRFVGLETVEEDDGVVVAIFENLHHGTSSSSSSTQQRVRTPWLVGCDSTHSAVRQAAGIEMEGTKAARYAWGADCTVDDDAPSICTGTDADGGSSLFLTIRPGRARLGGIYLPHQVPAGARPDPPSEAFLRAWAKRSFGGRDFGLRDVTWTAAIGDGMSTATTLRAGRVFIAGDAAHRLFPAGGQGMNTGLLDATNLAWKLALVVTGRIAGRAAVERVLDSYTRERRAAIRAVLKNVHVQVLVFFKQTESEQDVADFIAEAFDQPEFNRLYARRVSGFGDPTEPYRDSEAYCGAGRAAHELVGTRLTHVSDAHDGEVLQAARENVFVLAPVGDQGAEFVGALQIPGKHHGRYKTLGAALQPTDRKWDGVKAVLLRPDLRVAWVHVSGEDSASETGVEAMSNALSWWYGEPQSG